VEGIEKVNERIKQLWDQAAKIETDPSWEGQTKFMEKFAELIVRECIQAVKNVGGYNEEYHMNAIKKYFGVEE
jgi:hypothetical protein